MFLNEWYFKCQCLFFWLIRKDRHFFNKEVNLLNLLNILTSISATLVDDYVVSSQMEMIWHSREGNSILKKNNVEKY